MLKIINFEFAKVWRSKIFILTIFILLLVNCVLLAKDNNTINGISAGAYKAVLNTLSDKTQKEKVTYLQEYTNDIINLGKIEEFYSNPYYANNEDAHRLWEKENVSILKKYGELYLSNNYLNYTNNLQYEIAFNSIIGEELSFVNNYQGFLDDIQNKASKLSTISIFTETNDSYQLKNIAKTATAYSSIKQVSIHYLPQYGIAKALDFYSTDIIFIVCIIVLAYFILCEEKESGILSLIRTTFKGHFATILSKLFVLALSEIVILFIFYGSNLIICNSMAGLGNLFRSIQSVAFLRSSLLQINLVQYICLFLVTKWIAVFIIGVWVLIATLIAKTPLYSMILSSTIILLNMLVYIFIPATSRYNIAKYANLFGLLNTNEIIGAYRNLYWFGNPISIISVAIISSLIYISILIACLIWVYCKSQFPERIKTTTSSILVIAFWKAITKISSNYSNKYELVKHYIINGATIILAGFLLFQLNLSFQKESYVDATEVMYKQYLIKYQGDYTQKTYEAIANEYRMFEEKQSTSTFLFNDMRTKEILDKIVATNITYVVGTSGAHILYDTGYLLLFGIIGDCDFEEALYASILVVLLFSMLFTYDNKYSMTRLFSTTQAGLKNIAKDKFKIASFSSLMIALLTTMPHFFEILRDYGLSGILSPARSIRNLSYYPKFIPIILVFFISFIIRFMVINSAARIICSLTYRRAKFIESFSISFIVLVLPILLSYIGVPQIEWLSIYPAYHFIGVTSISILDGIGVCLIMIFWQCCGWLCKEHVIHHWGLLTQ